MAPTRSHCTGTFTPAQVGWTRLFWWCNHVRQNHDVSSANNDSQVGTSNGLHDQHELSKNNGPDGEVGDGMQWEVDLHTVLQILALNLAFFEKVTVKENISHRTIGEDLEANTIFLDSANIHLYQTSKMLSWASIAIANAWISYG